MEQGDNIEKTSTLSPKEQIQYPEERRQIVEDFCMNRLDTQSTLYKKALPWINEISEL